MYSHHKGHALNVMLQQSDCLAEANDSRPRPLKRSS